MAILLVYSSDSNGCIKLNKQTLPQPRITPLPVRKRLDNPQPKGLPVVNISFNESPFAPTEGVLDAIDSATRQVNRYGSPYCDSLRNKLEDTFNIPADNIICGNGSEELLDVIGRAYACAGDEILIPQYGYIQFPIVAQRVNAQLVKAPEPELVTDVDQLLTKVTEKTKIVFLANPNNPTGTMIPVQEMQRLADQLPSKVLLVIDLAYAEFTGDAKTVDDYLSQTHALVNQHANVMVTRTFSKAYSLAGLRVGWCHAAEPMMNVLYAARGMGTVNAAAQAAAIASLEDMPQMRNNVDLVRSERDRLSSALQSAGYQFAPSATNFLMMTFAGATADGADKLAKALFDETGILVNRTREAGLEHYIRFSMALPPDNDRLLDFFEIFSSQHDF